MKKNISLLLIIIQIIILTPFVLAAEQVQIADTMENGPKSTWITYCKNGTITSDGEKTIMSCDTSDITGEANTRMAVDKINASEGIDISFAFSVEKNGSQTVNRYIRLINSDSLDTAPSEYIGLVNIKNNSLYIGETECVGVESNREYRLFVHMSSDKSVSVWLDDVRYDGTAETSGDIDLENVRAFLTVMYGRKKDVQASMTIKNLSVTNMQQTNITCDKVKDGILSDSNVRKMTIFTGACQFTDYVVSLKCDGEDVEYECLNYGGILILSFNNPLISGKSYTLSVNDIIFEFKSLPGEYTKPEVTISGIDNSDAYVNDTLDIEVNASSLFCSISNVRLYVNNELVKSSNQQFIYSLSIQSEGTYSVYAEVTDEIGVSVVSSTVYFTAINRKPPEVTITITGEYTEDEAVSVSANTTSENGAIEKVEFYLDDKLIETDESAPYECSIRLKAGEQQIYAVSYDIFGIRGESEKSVVNAEERVKPHVQIEGLLNGIILKKNITSGMLLTEYTCDISEVKLYFDGEATETVKSDNGYMFSVQPKLYGRHIIKADIKAADGNSASYEYSVNIVDSEDEINCIYDYDDNASDTVWYQDNEGTYSVLQFDENDHKKVMQFKINDGKSTGPILNCNSISDSNGIIMASFDIYRNSEAVKGSITIRGTRDISVLGFNGAAITLYNGSVIQFPAETWVTLKVKVNLLNGIIEENIYIENELTAFNQSEITGLIPNGSIRLLTFFTSAGENDYFLIDNVNVSGTVTKPYISEVSEAAWDAECVDVIMSDDMGTLNTADMVGLSNDIGDVSVKKVETSGNVIHIYPQFGFDSFQNYRIVLKENTLLAGDTFTIGNDITESFTTTAKPFDIIGGYYSDDRKTFTAAVQNNTGENKRITVIVVAFKNGMFSGFEKKNDTILPGTVKSIQIICPQADGNITFKAFAVGDMSSRTPIANKIY